MYTFSLLFGTAKKPGVHVLRDKKPGRIKYPARRLMHKIRVRVFSAAGLLCSRNSEQKNCNHDIIDIFHIEPL